MLRRFTTSLMSATTTPATLKTAHKACSMAYCVESTKDFDTTCTNLEAAVKKHGFGVMHIHKIHESLKAKGVEIPEQTTIFEVCNPVKAKEVLAAEMLMSLALPCRIGVFTEKGIVKVAQLSPNAMMSLFNIEGSEQDHLKAVAGEVTSKTENMIRDACCVCEIEQ